MTPDEVSPPPEASQRLELLISRLLRGGVVASMATVSLGVLLMFAHHPDYFNSAADLHRLTAAGAAFPKTLRDVASGVASLRGQAIVVLGLLVLIATPILRVAVAIVAFALQRDRTYALISAVVLIVLLLSFLLGSLG
jgi:uncharacterized membrane protein